MPDDPQYDDPGPTTVVRHEEQLRVEKEWVPDRTVTARKTVETVRVDEYIPRAIEYADAEHAPANEDDSGEIETLPDGSVSIPVIEEQVFVTKRRVVRERIIIRKTIVTEQIHVQEDLRREHVEIDADAGVDVKNPGTAPFPGTERWTGVAMRHTGPRSSGHTDGEGPPTA